MSTTLKSRLSILLRIAALAASFLVFLIPGTNAQDISVVFQSPEFLVSPGETISGTIPVTNVADYPNAVRIYAGDWLRNPANLSTYEFDLEGGNEPRSFLGWLTFSPERMTLEPGETREVTYQVVVPQDTTLTGSYWGVIFVEGIPEEEVNLEGASPDELVAVGIRTIFRYAIQIYATIKDTEFRKAIFTSFDMNQVQDGINVEAVMENQGNIFVRPKVWLELRNDAGETVYTQEHKEITLLPESSRAYTFHLTNIPVESGEYMVIVIADYGVPSLVAAQGRIDLVIDQPQAETQGESEGAETGSETGQSSG